MTSDDSTTIHPPSLDNDRFLVCCSAHDLYDFYNILSTFAYVNLIYMLLKILYVTIGVLLLPTFSYGQISKKQAIRLAEQFVTDNGYCQATGDKSKLKYELLDMGEPNIDSLFSRRRHSLHCKVFCFIETQQEWDIGFLSFNVNLDSPSAAACMSDLSGRAVIISKDGKDARMEHKSPLFSKFDKL